jgi:hypothetical protein
MPQFCFSFCEISRKNCKIGNTVSTPNEMLYFRKQVDGFSGKRISRCTRKSSFWVKNMLTFVPTVPSVFFCIQFCQFWSQSTSYVQYVSVKNAENEEKGKQNLGFLRKN